MWLDLVVALSSCAAGLTGGWIMRSLHMTAVDRRRRNSVSNDSACGGTVTQEQISAIAARLNESACTMAADVDAHQNRVQEVSDSLQSPASANSSGSVLQAVNQLISANEGMQLQLQEAQERIREQTIQIQSAEQRALTDALTHVFNRRAFDEYLAEQESLGPPKAGTLVLLDIDHFKRLNDVHGHRAGDEVLGVVSGILAARLAAAGMVARFGGEEFAVVLNDRPVRQCIDLVEEVRQAIGKREIIFDGASLRITVCVGMAELRPGEKASSWLQRADEALYRSKHVGRDCGHWMNENVPVRMELSGGNDRSDVAAGGERSSGNRTREAPRGESAALTQQIQQPPSYAERTPRSAAGETANGMVDTRSDASAAEQASWEEIFEQVRSRAEAVGRTIFLMAVRFNGSDSGGVMRSLLQLVRAGTRNVDRIGCEDSNTLVLCMPSVDEEIAAERANSICRAAEAMQLGGEIPPDVHRVSIAITAVLAEETFLNALARVRTAAREASERSNDAVELCHEDLVCEADAGS